MRGLEEAVRKRPRRGKQIRLRPGDVLSLSDGPDDPDPWIEVVLTVGREDVWTLTLPTASMGRAGEAKVYVVERRTLEGLLADPPMTDREWPDAEFAGPSKYRRL